MISSLTDTKKYKCAVLLSTYNGSKYLECQIDSILRQADIDVHIIVRDDGSSDNTLDILAKYKERYPKKFFIVPGNNKGIHFSFCELFNFAGFDYDLYSFCDQDDIWDDDKLKIAAANLNENDCDLYSSCSRLIDSEGNYLNRTTESKKTYLFYANSEHKLFTPGIQGCTIVITNKFYRFLYESGFPNNLGHDTWIPIVANYFFKTFYDSIPHMNYRQHGSSWTGNRGNRLKHFFTSFKQFKKGLCRYVIIASMIANKYSNLLTTRQLDYLRPLLTKGNFFTRLFAIFKNHYRKKGLLETIFFRLSFLFGRIFKS